MSDGHSFPCGGDAELFLRVIFEGSPVSAAYSCNVTLICRHDRLTRRCLMETAKNIAFFGTILMVAIMFAGIIAYGVMS